MSKSKSFGFWNYVVWMGLGVFFYTQEQFRTSAGLGGLAVLTTLVQIKRSPKGQSSGWPVGAVIAATWIIIALERVFA